MKKRINHSITIAITVCITLGMLCPGYSATAVAASKAPSQPLLTKLTTSKAIVTLKWKKAKNAKKYQVFVKEGNGKYRAVRIQKKTTYSFKGKNGTWYRIKVKGINGKKKGAFSDEAEFKLRKGKSVKIDYRTMPGQVVITKLIRKNHKATIKWKKTRKAKKYQVYLKTGKGKFKLVKTTKKLTWSFKGKYNVKYQVKVRGISGKKKGTFSKVKKFTLSRTNNDGIDVTKYRYSVRPLLAPFNNIIYVATANPDPTSFRLQDRSSRYIKKNGKDTGVFTVLDYDYYDVKYEKKKTHRVKGGYLFYCYECDSDGGKLMVQEKSGSRYKNTGITVSCETIKDSTDYLIDTFAGKTSSFFGKLDAVQEGLNSLNVYPRSFQKTSIPSKEYPFPFLAVSPYPELTLNDHYAMYEGNDEHLLISGVYPFTLDSLGTPGIMLAVAKRLNSNVTYEYTDYHYLVKIKLNGETKSYGGAGSGGSGPVYSMVVDSFYTFDRSQKDLSVGNDMAYLKEKLLSYYGKTDETLNEYESQLTGKTFTETIGTGNWLRVRIEGFEPLGKSYAYAPYSPTWLYASDAWVDGRYIGEHECWEKGAVFNDHPKSGIILQNVEYTDYNGRRHKNDVWYEYDSETGQWSAPFYFADKGYYSHSILDEMPDELILTQEEVEAMNSDPGRKLDRNTNSVPQHGLIYDGTKSPGTPF